LATAGAGDVLSGMITGLPFARGFCPRSKGRRNNQRWLHVEAAPPLLVAGLDRRKI